ncbi:MAG: hypothetical protein ACYS47_18995 [Planctomycetota bacterium]|jgi:hypothetical protein
MKWNFLVVFNVAVSSALIVAVAVLFLRNEPTASVPVPGQEAGPSSAGAASGEQASSLETSLGDLESRVANLEREAEVWKESASRGKPAKKAAGAAEAGENPADRTEVEEGDPSNVDDPSRLVTRGEVKKLVEKQLEDSWRQWRESQRAAWEERRNRKKKTVREVARELAFTPDQERTVFDTYKEMEKETMKILFEIKDDKDLETLKAQLKEAEFDPELKAKLREKISVNWTLYQKQVEVLWVKADAKMRKAIPAKKLEQFYRADPDIGDGEYPDLEKMFFSEEEGEGEGR